MLKHTFLGRVYSYNRWLFIFMSSFAFLTAVANFSGDQITPFFVWGMYSERLPARNEYTVLRTTINDTVFIDTHAHFSDNTRFYLNAPLQYYKKIKEANNIDPSVLFLREKLKEHYRLVQPLEEKLFNVQPVSFMDWYQRYLHQIIQTPVNSMKIEIIKTHYNQAKQIIADSTYIFEQWKKP